MAPGESDQAQDAAAAPAAAADSAASTPQPKAPPPESPAETTRRSYIILSFWVIVLFLGLPIWWRTTTIYRANLPIDDMLQWADGKVSSIIPPTPRPPVVFSRSSTLANSSLFPRLAVQSCPCTSRSRPSLYRIKRPSTSCT